MSEKKKEIGSSKDWLIEEVMWWSKRAKEYAEDAKYWRDKYYKKVR